MEQQAAEIENTSLPLQIDSGEREILFRLNSVKYTITKEGYYEFSNVKVARSGPFDYGVDELIHDGALDQGYKRGQILKGYRPKETFTQEVIDSIKGMPLLIDHPKSGLSTPENTKNHGALVDPYMEEGSDGNWYLVISKVILHTREIINEYNRGKKELSIGFYYKKPVEWTSGSNFNFIEEIVKINHLALVDKGRAGPGCRLHNETKGNSIMDDKLDKLAELSMANTAAISTLCEKVGDLVRINKDMAEKEEKKSKEEEDCKTNEKPSEGGNEESKNDSKKEKDDKEEGRKNDVFMLPTDFVTEIIKALPDNTVWGYSVGEKAFTGESAPKVLKLFKDEASARNLESKMARTHQLTQTTNNGGQTQSGRARMHAVGD